jgi:hypothetical protein
MMRWVIVKAGFSAAASIKEWTRKLRMVNEWEGEKYNRRT